MSTQPTRPDEPASGVNREWQGVAGETGAGAAPRPTPGAGRPEPPALDPSAEKELWEGRPSWKSAYPTILVGILLAAGVTVLVGLLSGQSSSTWTALLVCAGLLVLALLRVAWQIWSVSYRITTQRLFIRRGILTRTVDQAELLRVDDVKTRQTLLERVLGIGQVEVMSSDRTDTRISLVSIENPDSVAEHIRRHTRTLQRRTLFMEQL